MHLDDARLRKALADLSPQINEKVRKQGARNALSPYLKSLRGVWLSTIYRGKPTHRRSIASATRVDIRRRGSGPTAGLQIRMGVQYGQKGGAKAKGRQRVWHLLEAGFRHASNNQSYTNFDLPLRRQRDERAEWVKMQRSRIFQTIRGNKFEQKSARRDAMKAMYAAARTQWAELESYKQSRRRRVEQDMKAASRIPGRRLSSAWAQRNIQQIGESIVKQTLAAAKSVLKL